MASITIQTNDSQIVADQKKKHLELLATNVDVDVLKKLAELSTNSKAVSKLKNTPLMLIKAALL